MTSAPAKKRNSGKFPEPALKVVRQVALLPEGMQKAIRELLVQGATAEGAAQSVNERADWDESAEGRPGIMMRHNVTSEAIRNFYNGDREIQRDRARFMVETTEGITRSLSDSKDLNDGEARYVRAVVMAGLSRLNDSDTPLSVKDSLRLRSENENLLLKNRLLRLRDSHARAQEAYWKAQRALVDEKRKFLTEQTAELSDKVRNLEKKRKLTPEMLQKIQETYGFLAESAARAEAEFNAPPAELEAAAETGAIEEAPEPLYFAKPEEITDPRQVLRETAEELYRRSVESEGER